MNNKFRKTTLTMALALMFTACAGSDTPINSSSTANTSSATDNSSSPTNSSNPSSSSPITSSSAASVETATIQESERGFCTLDGAIETEHTGFTGTGYANADNASGADITWQIHSAGAQTANFTLRYANGGDAARVANLSVNGANAQPLQFAVTGWSNWQELTVNLNLSAGSQSIRLTSDSATGLANIDSLTVAGENIVPDDCPLPPPEPVAMATDRWYILVNRDNNLAFDIQDMSTELGAPLTQWEQTETENQQFRFVDAGNNQYRIIARHSELAVTLFDSITGDGADIIQFSGIDGENPLFEIRDLHNGYVQIVNRLSNRALAPENNSTVAGTRITQYSPSTDFAQQWQLIDFAAYIDEDAWTTTVPFTMSGDMGIHDPSTIVKDGDWYWTFGTGHAGNALTSLRSRDLMHWQRGPTINPGDPYPDWIDSNYPPNDNNLWAPDIIKMNGRFYLYYSVFASPVLNTAIGVMVTDSLNEPNWQDLGPVLTQGDERQTQAGEPTNVIDPGLFRSGEGRVWMVYGSHYAGIFVREINPQTGMLLNPPTPTELYSTRSMVAGNRGGWNEYEAAQIHYISPYYYLFVNLGGCCAAEDSDYIMVVGRSLSVQGPYSTRSGHNLTDGDAISPEDVTAITQRQGSGDTHGAVLTTQPSRVGPGHFGYINNKGQHLVSIHYYGGAHPWGHLGILEMTFENGWPVFNYDFELRQ